MRPEVTVKRPRMRQDEHESVIVTINGAHGEQVVIDTMIRSETFDGTGTLVVNVKGKQAEGKDAWYPHVILSGEAYLDDLDVGDRTSAWDNGIWRLING